MSQKTKAAPTDSLNKPNSYLGFAMFVFAYAVVVAVAVQFVVLPYWLPSLHKGDGLLEVSDSNLHHRIAIEQSEKIKAEGWQAWVLRPSGQAPAGIASIFYTIIAPKPWTMIPLNALLHAFAAVMLLRILDMFIPRRRWSILVMLPFVLFPSAILWYAQILKDGFSIAGALSLLVGLVMLSRLDLKEKPWGTLLEAIFFVMLGNTLAWIVRPYLVLIFQGITALCAITLSGYWLYHARKQKQWLNAALGILVAWALIFAAEPLTARGIEEELPPSKDGSGKVVVGRYEWTYSNWIPKKVEEMMFTLGVIRHGVLSTTPDAVSNIDANVEFHHANDLLFYLPRALQISLLAPFPKQWFEPGSTASTQIMRSLSALEMTFVYVSLLGFLLALWRWRKRIELYIVLLFSSSALVIMGVSVPNIGSLYRIRFSFLIVLVTLGVAAIFIAIEHRKNSSKPL